MADNKISVGMVTLGMIGTNCYFLFREDSEDSEGYLHCIFVDPADKGRRIYDALMEKKIKVDLILLTHGHFDHIGGVKELKDLTGAGVGCYIKEQAICQDPFLNVGNDYGMDVTVTPDYLYQDGELITAAGMTAKLIATPGHTSGSCCFYFEEEGILISGDTLFEESIGRTDFPTGSTGELINSVKDKLFCLPDETIIYPGHGELTTIGHEKLYNPFII